MASIAAERVIETLRDVDKGVVPWFRDAAKTWLKEVGDPEEALALALAKITGEGVVGCVSACNSIRGY
jgi:ATP-dependent RNA helicase DDX21